MNYFLNRYKKWGHALEKIDLPTTIRISNRISDQKLIKRLDKKEVLLKKVPFLSHGYTAISDFSLASMEEHLLGYFYIQEQASQLASEVLSPGKEDLVLDMCAAPGSKTTHMSDLMENEGAIIALDNNIPRLHRLKINVLRMKSANIAAYKKDAKFADDLGIEFDKILLDAPCSGNFITDDEWFEKRDFEGIRANAREQKSMIAAAYASLKPGGRLLYSTCSFEIEENEEVVEFGLSLGLRLLPIKIPIGQPGLTKETELCKRFWPDTEKTQGFFMALLTK